MIALIAGQGGLPRHLAAALPQAEIHCLEGFAPEGLTARPFRVEGLGSLIQGLVARGVRRVCFAGSIARPPLDPSRIDAATMPLVPRMMQALASGDDAGLRMVLSFFEEAGLTPVAATDLCPDLLPPLGDLSGAMSAQDQRDLARARAVHGALSPLDVGQGLVVAGGQVLAIEALPGTDWMLASLSRRPKSARAPEPPKDPGDPFEWAFGGAADWLSGTGAPPPVNSPRMPDFPRPAGGLLFKAPKSTQDRRIDLPAIGPETIARAAAAGLNGIALAQGGVMILERAATQEAARAAGLFLSVVPDAPAP